MTPKNVSMQSAKQKNIITKPTNSKFVRKYSVDTKKDSYKMIHQFRAELNKNAEKAKRLITPPLVQIDLSADKSSFSSKILGRDWSDSRLFCSFNNGDKELKYSNSPRSRRYIQNKGIACCTPKTTKLENQRFSFGSEISKKNAAKQSPAVNISAQIVTDHFLNNGLVFLDQRKQSISNVQKALGKTAKTTKNQAQLKTIFNKKYGESPKGKQTSTCIFLLLKIS